MSTPPNPSPTGSRDRRFPPEAFQAQDDVTPEAVEFMRRRAAGKIEGRDWRSISGLGIFGDA